MRAVDEKLIINELGPYCKSSSLLFSYISSHVSSEDNLTINNIIIAEMLPILINN